MARRSYQVGKRASLEVLALIVCLVLFAAGCSSAGEPTDQSTSDGSTVEPSVEDEEPESDGLSLLSEPFRPDSVAADATSVWVSDAACGVVVQIDKGTEEVLGAVTAGSSASGVAVAGGSVWVGTRGEGTVVRIDPVRRVVRGSVSVPGAALGLTAQGDELWATDPLFGVVYRIDARSSQLIETVEVGLNPHHVAIGTSTVWVTNKDDDTVTMIGTRRGRAVVGVAVGDQPLHVELGGGSAWVTDSADGAVRRLDENTGELEAVIDVGIWPHALAFANGAVWVGTETGSFWKIDPASNTSTRVDDADFMTIDTVVDGTDIWIADASGGTVVRFDAATGSVGSVVDLREFGDCQTFRDQALDPRRDGSL